MVFEHTDIPQINLWNISCFEDIKELWKEEESEEPEFFYLEDIMEDFKNK